MVALFVRKSSYFIPWELLEGKHGENYFGECLRESTPWERGADASFEFSILHASNFIYPLHNLPLILLHQ